MSEWKEYRLGDFLKVKHGYAFKGENIVTEETPNILVTPGNFNIGGGFKSDKFKYYKGDEFPKEYILTSGDIVVTMTDLSKDSDTLGYSAKIPYSTTHNYLHNQRIGLVQFVNENVCKDFVYWLMRTREYQNYIVGSASGTSIMHTSPSRIEDYRCLIPSSQSEQESIASLLTSIDNKIDLLHRENKTLEAMAETLFRQWLIEEAKEDWEEMPLSFYGKIVCGKTPPKKESKYFGGETPFIKIPDMHNKTFVINSEDSLTKEGVLYQKEKILPPFSIIVSCIATVGLVVLNAKEAQTNQQINSIIPYEEEYRYFLYLHLINMYDDLNAMASGGTATLNLNTSNFSKIKIAYPTDDVLCAFNKQVSLLFDKIYNNQQQIQTLIQQRDSLLPKLMSGEVKI